MRALTVCAALMLTGVLALPADAHHSYAMFDSTRVIEIQGTVKTWEFTNPHAFLFLYVTGNDGKQAVWGMEAPSPGSLIRKGWTRNTVKPGDVIKVELNPLKDGRTGGNLRKVTLADGKFICAPAAGTPSFHTLQASDCAGTIGGPAVVAGDGDARAQGNTRPVAPAGSKPVY